MHVSKSTEFLRTVQFTLIVFSRYANTKHIHAYSEISKVFHQEQINRKPKHVAGKPNWSIGLQRQNEPQIYDFTSAQWKYNGCLCCSYWRMPSHLLMPTMMKQEDQSMMVWIGTIAPAPSVTMQSCRSRRAISCHLATIIFMHWLIRYDSVFWIEHRIYTFIVMRTEAVHLPTLHVHLHFTYWSAIVYHKACCSQIIYINS